jgi:hypothetical protein
MTLEVWPTSPPPSFSYPLEDEYETVISVAEGTNEVAQMNRRFPKRGFAIGYDSIALGTDWATIHNFHTARLGAYETFWFFDFLSRPWTDIKVGRGDGSTTTFDLPSKNTVNDSSLIIKVNDTPVSKSFSSGTGLGGADQIIIAAPALGALITAAFKGQLRLKARKADRFADKFDLDEYGKIEVFQIRGID